MSEAMDPIDVTKKGAALAAAEAGWKSLDSFKTRTK